MPLKFTKKRNIHLDFAHICLMDIVSTEFKIVNLKKNQQPGVGLHIIWAATDAQNQVEDV